MVTVGPGAVCGCSFPAPAGPPASPDSSERALQRLISGAVSLDELSSLIESIFSSENATGMVRCLQGINAQTFVDMVDEVRIALSSSRNQMIDLALNLLYPDRRWRALISRQRYEINV